MRGIVARPIVSQKTVLNPISVDLNYKLLCGYSEVNRDSYFTFKTLMQRSCLDRVDHKLQLSKRRFCDFFSSRFLDPRSSSCNFERRRSLMSWSLCPLERRQDRRQVLHARPRLSRISFMGRSAFEAASSRVPEPINILRVISELPFVRP